MIRDCLRAFATGFLVVMAAADVAGLLLSGYVLGGAVGGTR